MKEEDSRFTDGAEDLSNTCATNPGRIELDLSVYFRCFPEAMLPGPVPGIHISETVGWHMSEGDTCPALILDPSSGLIAVLAEMSSKPYSSFEAIKILHVPLENSPSKPFHAGQRITTVCTFEGSLKKGRWDDFNPIPVVCATKDQAAISRSLGSIPEKDWARLENVVKSVTAPQPGLYSLKSSS